MKNSIDVFIDISVMERIDGYFLTFAQMQYLSLFELNNHLKSVLRQHLEPSYWVVAEIGEIRINQRGHCYMELVEKEDEHLHAKIKATMWASNYRNISGCFETITGKNLKLGMKILANVIVDFHEIYGLSLNIRDIDPNFTLGERVKKRQQTIDQLTSEGVFHLNKKLQLPIVPQRIALISSATAAGFEDFMHQLTNNPQRYQFKATLFKATMQGNEAKQSVIDAMHKILDGIDNYDVLVIIRGGGAQVDLDCFDTYEMAAHVAQFPIPVLSGIGHERDETVLDLVAHTSLKTPTAVSAFLINTVEYFEVKINALTERMVMYAENHLKKCEYDLYYLKQKFIFSNRQNLSSLNHQLSGFCERVKRGSKRNLILNSVTLKKLGEALKNKSMNCLNKEVLKLEQFKKNINYLNPENILKRGYSITHVNKIFINHIKDVKTGDKISTITADKEIESTIEQIKIKDNEQSTL